MKIGSIVIDCFDFEQMMHFWQEALHYIPKYPPKNGWVILTDFLKIGPNISLNKVEDRLKGRNWIHLDLYVDSRDEEIDRLIKLGAKLHSQEYDIEDDFRVLEDPDGNLFCIVQMRKK